MNLFPIRMCGMVLFRNPSYAAWRLIPMSAAKASTEGYVQVAFLRFVNGFDCFVLACSFIINPRAEPDQ